MAIFAVIPSTPNASNPGLAAAVDSKFKDANFPLDGGVGWLVAGKHTAKDVSDALGVSDGNNGAALIIEMSSYFGRANPNIWTWIKLHWETGRGA